MLPPVQSVVHKFAALNNYNIELICESGFILHPFSTFQNRLFSSDIHVYNCVFLHFSPHYKLLNAPTKKKGTLFYSMHIIMNVSMLTNFTLS